MIRSFGLGLALKNLRSDWFSTLCAIIGVALGTATVSVVLTLDVSTGRVEQHDWRTNPNMKVDLERTVLLTPLDRARVAKRAEDAKEETHEDYQVMRSAIRLGSLSAFLVGALIVFFTFRVVVAQRKKEIALLRSLGASRPQVARIFFLEAVIIGVTGAGLGIVISIPLTVIAAILGISTTGRVRIWALHVPWRYLFIVAGVGASTALLGVLRPLRDVLSLDVPQTLRPQSVGAEGAPKAGGSSVALIAIPFMVLLYVLIRPFFFEVLPSLAFFVLEAGFVCAAFLSLLVFVPRIINLLGGAAARLLPGRRGPSRFLTEKRIARAGQDLAWSVSGVMLVFALLLGLHVVTRSLKLEVSAWAERAVRPHAYVFHRGQRRLVPENFVLDVPPEAVRVDFSGRTPWPNPLLAVDGPALAKMAADIGNAEHEMVRRLTKGKVLLSSLMARRYDLEVGEFLRVESARRTAELEVIGVSDDVGYTPMIGPYRNSKTYGLVSKADYDLIAPYAGPVGTSLAFRLPGANVAQADAGWLKAFGPRQRFQGYRVEIGRQFVAGRIRETDRDFVIFDFILFLTAVLAAIGVANNLILSAHLRRRELALFRTLGMTARQIGNLFVTEGIFIGVFGGVLAGVLGIPLGLLAIGALKIISAFDVQFSFPPSYIVWALAGAIFISVTSALYPAYRAARAPTAEATHYE